MSSLPLSPSPHQPSQQSPAQPSLLQSANITTSHLPEALPQESASNNEPEPSPPPNFSPFFTLLTTTPSPTTHHPTIHYIFTSDTPSSDPITAAALQVLDPTSSDTNNNSPESSATKERYILLDMDATGTNVVAAQSMSADWAVTATEVVEAPTWDDGGEGRGMMLRIEGMEVVGKGEEGEERALEELVEVWERRMGELRGVVGMGGRVGGVKGE